MIDGPFTESKEIVGGYAIIDAKTRDEALALARRFMELHLKHWPTFEGECETRPFEEEVRPPTARIAAGMFDNDRLPAPTSHRGAAADRMRVVALTAADSGSGPGRRARVAAAPIATASLETDAAATPLGIDDPARCDSPGADGAR